MKRITRSHMKQVLLFHLTHSNSYSVIMDREKVPGNISISRKRLVSITEHYLEKYFIDMFTVDQILYVVSSYYLNSLRLLLITTAVVWRASLDISILAETGGLDTKEEEPYWILQNPNVIQFYGTRRSPNPIKTLIRENWCFFWKLHT